MNELEKQIEERATDWVFEENGHRWSNNDDSAGDNTESFKAGCNFILEKNLMAKFLEWVHKNIITCSWSIDGISGEICFCLKGSLSDFELMATKFDKIIAYNYEGLQDYWLNEVYGKEK